MLFDLIVVYSYRRNKMGAAVMSGRRVLFPFLSYKAGLREEE